MKRLFSKKALAAVLSAGLLATSSGALSVFASNEVEHVVSQAATDEDIYWDELSQKSDPQSKTEQNSNSTLSKIKVALSTAKNKVATFITDNNSTSVKVALVAAVPVALMSTYFAAKVIKICMGGCPDGTTLVDGECKDYVKAIGGVCPPGFKWERKFKKEEGKFFSTYEDFCRCKGAATLKNGKCVPHDGATLGFFTNEWYCLNGSIAEGGKCT